MSQRIDITDMKLSDVRKHLEDKEEGHVESKEGKVWLVVDTE